MFPTPDISHLTSAVYQSIYEPAEDSFLLLDALEKEADYLKCLRPLVCVEVGTGSGICITFLGQMLGNTSLYIGTDVNPAAAEVSRQTASRNNVTMEPVLTDLYPEELYDPSYKGVLHVGEYARYSPKVSALSPRLHGSVDVLIFNPPYVVTPSEEVGGSGIEASWAGGDKGREVTDRLLPHVPKLLSPGGAFYLLIIKENDQDDLETIMKSHGFSMTVVLTRRSGPEFLSVLKFVREKKTEKCHPDG